MTEQNNLQENQVDTENQRDSQQPIVENKKPIKNANLSKIIKIAIFSALAFIFMLIKFPIFPAVGFLDFDFSSVFSLIGGFMLGPLAGVLIEFFKLLLKVLIVGTPTSYIGELSNLINSVAFVLPATLLYKYKKGIKWVIIGLVCSLISTLIVAVLSSYFLIYPLFIKFVTHGGMQHILDFKFILTWVPAFNLIKFGSNAIIVFLLYKRIKFLFRW